MFTAIMMSLFAVIGVAVVVDSTIAGRSGKTMDSRRGIPAGRRHGTDPLDPVDRFGDPPPDHRVLVASGRGAHEGRVQMPQAQPLARRGAPPPVRHWRDAVESLQVDLPGITITHGSDCLCCHVAEDVPGTVVALHERLEARSGLANFSSLDVYALHLFLAPEEMEFDLAAAEESGFIGACEIAEYFGMGLIAAFDLGSEGYDVDPDTLEIAHEVNTRIAPPDIVSNRPVRLVEVVAW